ncbi:MAG: LysR family transcriptional regulator [Lentisphaeria bacterium]|nr:LysR family transcriptional regulator [Lentisphaeria bacterium]
MELNQLRYFILTAKELHFARAAAKLGVTQPSLSRGIQTLEKELGTPLFLRTNKWHVAMTPAGEAFLPEAEKAMRQLRYAENRARAAGEGKFGRLTVGALSSTLGKSAFIDTLAEMNRKYPGVTLEVIDSNSAELASQIRERALDLAFMRDSPELKADEELVCEKCYDDSLAVVLPHTHKLARKKELKVADLAHERFILVPMRTSPSFRNYVCGFCAARGGFSPLTSDEISSSYAALRLVEAGMGITIVSASYAGLFNDRLCYRQFSDFHPALPVYAVYSDADIPLPLKNFLSMLRKNLARAPEKF